MQVLSQQEILMIIEGLRDTLIIVGFSTFFGYVLGLPLGIILAVTDKDGIKPNLIVYKTLDLVTNILRRFPSIILLELSTTIPSLSKYI